MAEQQPTEARDRTIRISEVMSYTLKVKYDIKSVCQAQIMSRNNDNKSVNVYKYIGPIAFDFLYRNALQ